uniref:Uncharacterized protein n=1 Tax=Parascaris equorum TaxID=6256 RepID=A0A914S888_PAREQ
MFREQLSRYEPCKNEKDINAIANCTVSFSLNRRAHFIASLVAFDTFFKSYEINGDLRSRYQWYHGDLIDTRCSLKFGVFFFAIHDGIFAIHDGIFAIHDRCTAERSVIILCLEYLH